jgi:hypothetical protein
MLRVARIYCLTSRLENQANLEQFASATQAHAQYIAGTVSSRVWSAEGFLGDLARAVTELAAAHESARAGRRAPPTPDTARR